MHCERFLVVLGVFGVVGVMVEEVGGEEMLFFYWGGECLLHHYYWRAFYRFVTFGGSF